MALTKWYAKSNGRDSARLRAAMTAARSASTKILEMSRAGLIIFPSSFLGCTCVRCESSDAPAIWQFTAPLVHLPFHAAICPYYIWR